ncbi:MAG TPA: universal stress protein [Dictyobacter sp.]|jgi:nucleotide-binding universal stress UspA family protein|nr:universal stress protein [Dictyobacter sp.]
MKKRILLGVDSNFSSATQHAVRALGDLVQDTDPTISFILLHTIPMTHIVAEQPGYYVDQSVAFHPTGEDRKQAEAILQKAHAVLRQYGFEHCDVEHVIRIGAPAEEIASVARERNVQLIVIGSRGNGFRQRVRRMLLGSISRRVLQLAPCPVMVTPPPVDVKDENLVGWYKGALKAYLQEHKQSLTILTPQRVAKQFLPVNKETPGPKEIAAAATALDDFAQNGLLCRHSIEDGEMRYVND